jgi:hypothetical protein
MSEMARWLARLAAQDDEYTMMSPAGPLPPEVPPLSEGGPWDANCRLRPKPAPFFGAPDGG